MSTLLSNLKIFFDKFSGAEKKLLLLFIIALVAGAVWLGFQNLTARIDAPKAGGTYIEGLVGVPQYINPLLAPANDVDTDLSRVVYAGLLKFDPQVNLVPDMAESLPEISANGREYTLKLKDNLFWHDGLKVTADDVVFTYRAVQNPELGSPLRLSWNKVEVEKLDDRSVKLTTRESSAAFLANLTIGILPKHVWETVPAQSFALSQFNLNPIGTGPYQITELKRGRKGEIKEIVMKPNRQYYAEGPYLKELRFKFYETAEGLIDGYHAKEVMGLGYVPFDRRLFIEASPKIQQYKLPLSQYQAVFINRAKNPAPLEDVRVRLALAKSIDKKKIIAEVFGGQASEAYGPILPGHLGYHEQIPGADMNIYDVARATTLLDEAGWIPDSNESGKRKDKQGRIITLSLVTNNFTPNVRVAEELKKMWEEIGIQIVLNIETIADLEEKYIRPRNFELLILSENVGADPDPFPFWHSSQLRDPGLNLSTFSNKTADKLLIEARANIAAPDRAAKYRQFQEIFVGDAPAIFIDRSVFVYNISKKIKGLNFNTLITPSDRFADINRWYIKTKKVKK